MINSGLNKNFAIRMLMPLQFFLAGTALQAQQEMLLYKGIPPGNLSNNNIEAFSQSGARPYITKVSIPSVYYYPPTGKPSGCAVIICPGGGYSRLSFVDGGTDVGKAFAEKGVAAFVLKYRTWADSTFENYRDIPNQDLTQAYKLVKENAKAWNIDTAKIGVVGFSAGGHLASMATTSKVGLKFAFSVLVYPVISFTDSLVSPTLQSRKNLLGKNITLQDKVDFSPELNIGSLTPPTFLIHAEDDSTSMVANSLVYYRALVAKKIPGQLIIYQKGGHGFALHNKAQDEYWMPEVLKWLRLNEWLTGQ